MYDVYDCIESDGGDVGLCVGSCACLCTTLMYDVYNCIESDGDGRVELLI